jgi:hypothetical protein
VEKFYKGKEPEKIVDILDEICEGKIQEILNNSCNQIADYTNAFDKKIYFKREAIAEPNFSKKISDVFNKVYNVPISIRYIRMSHTTNLLNLVSIK